MLIFALDASMAARERLRSRLAAALDCGIAALDAARSAAIAAFTFAASSRWLACLRAGAAEKGVKQKEQRTAACPFVQVGPLALVRQ